MFEQSLNKRPHSLTFRIMSAIPNTYKTAFETRVSATEIKPVKTVWGTISHIAAQSIHVQGLAGIVSIGDLIAIDVGHERPLTGDVISLQGSTSLAMMHGSTVGLTVGQKAYIAQERPPAPSDDWIGRVLNHSGETVEGQIPLSGNRSVALHAKPPKAILRKPLGPRLETGIAAIDTFLPLCQGQRVGLFAGSGVGKSTLLASLAKGGNADINIIALIGERGREVRSFVEETLGADGMKKSIVFVATSDEPSALRLRTALLAMATAEHFRDAGRQVLFLCDSLTRYADAHRDVALTAGEVPSLRAYPPSTFGALSAYCERSGPGIDNSGDITAVFSVLVAGSDMEEPVADMVRGILDGHIILDRDIAERGRYPAINLSRSVSRSLPGAANDEQNAYLMEARKYIRHYEESKTLIKAGLYVSGTDPQLDKAIEVYEALDGFVGHIGEPNIEASFKTLAGILNPKDAEAAETQTD